LGAKANQTLAKLSRGVERVWGEAAQEQTLTAEQVRQLTQAGQQIQYAYGFPQDIEWAFAGGELFILQSRPITSLFPVPKVSFDPLIFWFSFGAFQGVVGPMTPLGREAIQRIVLGIGKKVGVQISFDEQDLLVTAGERIWAKGSDVIRNPLGNRLVKAFLGIGEPGTAQILRQITTDPRLGAGKGRVKFSTLKRMLGFILPALAELPRIILQPERARERFDARLEAYLQAVNLPGGADRFERLANLAAYMDDQGGLADALAFLLPRFMPIMAPSLAFLNLIARMLPSDPSSKHGLSMRVLDVTRGMPRNVTTEMDLVLWETASLIRADAAAADVFNKHAARTLATAYLESSLPAAAQAAVKQFMDRYGMRGIGEIDLGQPRWREDPTPVMQTLQSYQKIKPDAAPDLMFAKSTWAAEEAVEKLAADARGQHLGWIKEILVRGAARRVRLLLGARESPKFLIVRAMGILRKALLEIGEEFSAAGTIDRPGDLFFLHVAELEQLSRQVDCDWKVLISERRQLYEREQRRRQVPRVLVSDGRAFYEGVGVETDTGTAITGSPVSPGIVQGTVHVVLDPHEAQLSPGEILVCPGTDPAWTPLFMAAGGLIMEVGGMMTHGSVVAREYGIPAVVGVHQATKRLKDGQLIRLDGTSGRIVVIEEIGLENNQEGPIEGTPWG